MKALEIARREGVSFVRDGNYVTWQAPGDADPRSFEGTDAPCPWFTSDEEAAADYVGCVHAGEPAA